MLKIGHRGAAALAPENTLVSFRKAINLGVDMIELDIQLTKDQELVVFHDHDLNRIAGVDVQIKELTLAELKKFDIGSWFSKEFKNEKIPTLQEVIQLVNGQVKLNIELKPRVDKKQILIQNLVTILEKEDFKEEVIISSFNHSLLKYLKEIDSSLKTAILIVALPVNPVKVIDEASADGIHPNYLVVNKELIDKIQEEGYFLNTWTVNDESQINQLEEMDVDGIITDDPDLFKS
ncbi:glycerophosphodiester phosphodiesterase [Halanaerocella petrolearia]